MRNRITPEQILVLESELTRADINERVNAFAGDGPISRGVRHRRSQSYDHCFNYFADTADIEADLEKSCAVLGFYLASWGMYRGSSFLLRRTNSSDLIHAVRVINERRPELSKIDLDDYTPENIEAILDTYRRLKDALQIGRERHITLVTKIMVATLGCIPAFDQYFSEGFRRVLGDRARVPSHRLTADSLNILAAFYRANRNDIDTLHNESRTVAFGSDSVTMHKLSRAKIIDMFCFDLGRSPA